MQLIRAIAAPNKLEIKNSVASDRLYNQFLARKDQWFVGIGRLHADQSKTVVADWKRMAEVGLGENLEIPPCSRLVPSSQ